jgi:hypothetical protein
MLKRESVVPEVDTSIIIENSGLALRLPQFAIPLLFSDLAE